MNPNGVIDPLTGHISTDIDAILKGDADGDANATDLMAINEIRNLLFANGGLTDNGLDLMARDIERAREDGIGSYNDLRAAMGLQRVSSFSQITSNVTVQAELQHAYGSVENIDPFEGGLAEDHVSGSDMGPLFTRILANQFTRLRNGDRFFYQNEQWTQNELNLFWQGNTLAKIIEANTHVTNLQNDVFLFRASISGTVFFDANANGQRDSGESGIGGLKVELLNGNGDIVATTRTDFYGRYAFNQLSGPAANREDGSGISATGNYTVVLVSVVYDPNDGEPGLDADEPGQLECDGREFWRRQSSPRHNIAGAANFVSEQYARKRSQLGVPRQRVLDNLVFRFDLAS